MLKWKALRVVSGGLLLTVSGCGMEAGDGEESITEARSNLVPGGNDYGVAETFHTSGIDRLHESVLPGAGDEPAHLHDLPQPDQGWTMTSEANKQLFKDTDGLAPLFNLVDEGTRPDADISTKKARKATFVPNTMDLRGHALHAEHPGDGRVHGGARGSVGLLDAHEHPELPPAHRDGERDQGVEHHQHQRPGAGHPGHAGEPDARRCAAPRAARSGQPGAGRPAERGPRLHARHLLRADHRQRRGAPRRGRRDGRSRRTCRRSRSRSA